MKPALITGTLMLILFTALFAASDTDQDIPEADLIVIAGTLIDGTGRDPEHNIAVLIRGNQITALVPADRIPTDHPGVIDTGNLTILPGIIDTHVHVWSGYGGVFTTTGVTTVYDLGTVPDLIDGLRDRFTHRLSPRLFLAGPIITPSGGYMKHREVELERLMAVEAESPEHARELVRELVARYRLDMVKVAVTGLLFDRVPRIEPDVLQAIVDTAHYLGLRVFAHVDCGEDVRMALAAGVDVLAHMPVQSVPDDLLMSLVEADIIIIPTLDLASRSWTHRAALDNTRRFHRLGGTIALGSDAPVENVPYGMPVREMEILQFVGLSPMEIIVAGTRNAARALGIDDWLGTLQPEMTADLIAIEGDPLACLTALGEVRLVIKDGKIIHRRAANP